MFKNMQSTHYIHYMNDFLGPSRDVPNVVVQFNLEPSSAISFLRVQSGSQENIKSQ